MGEGIMYICICKAVTEDEVEKVVDSGVSDFEEIRTRSKACTDCGTCRFKLQRFINERASQKASVNPKKVAG